MFFLLVNFDLESVRCYPVLTDDDKPDSVDAGWMDGDLALVGALVTGPGVLDLKSPVVWVLKVEGEPGIGAIGLHADREEMEFLLVPPDP